MNGMAARTPPADCRTNISRCLAGDIECLVSFAVEGRHIGRSYKFEGTYRSLLLTATYCAGDERNLDSGSFTLMLADGGRKLIGGEAAHITATNTVGWFEYEWERPPR